jgi:hypothetical protein
MEFGAAIEWFSTAGPFTIKIRRDNKRRAFVYCSNHLSYITPESEMAGLEPAT